MVRSTTPEAETSTDDSTSSEGIGTTATTTISRVNCNLRRLKDVISSAGDGFDMPLLEQLNVHGNRIESMDGLESCVGLVEACLSSNLIQDINFHSLEPLKQLRILDLSANNLKSTRGFPRMPCLQELSLAYNDLASLDGFDRPVKFPRLCYLDIRSNDIQVMDDLTSLQHFKRLRCLRLQGKNGSNANPICDEADYPQIILQFLPQLNVLDEEETNVLSQMEVASMPKYHTLLRRMKQKQNQAPQPSPKWAPEKRRLSPPSPTPSPSPNPNVKSPIPKVVQQEKKTCSPIKVRMVVKEVGCNTEKNFDKEMRQRGEALSELRQQLSECTSQRMASEKRSLELERSLYEKEREWNSRLEEIQKELKDSVQRAVEAERTSMELSNLLIHQKEMETEKTEETIQTCDQYVQTTEEREKEIVEQALKMKQVLHDKDRSEDEWEKSKKEMSTRIYELETSVKDKCETITSLESTLKTQQSELQELKKELELETFDKTSMKQQHERSTSFLQEEIASFKHQISELERRKQQLECHTKELEWNIQTLHHKSLEKEATVVELKSSLRYKQDEIEKLHQEQTNITKRYEDFYSQQQTLWQEKLKAATIQMEAEFRREYTKAASKFQTAQQKCQSALREIHHLRSIHERNVAREQELKEKLQRFESMTSGGHVDSREAHRECQEEIGRLRTEKESLEKQLTTFLSDSQTMSDLESELEHVKTDLHQAEERHQDAMEQQSRLTKEKEDMEASIKVKDVMLADKQRQIDEYRTSKKEMEKEHEDRERELYAQIEELEGTLEDHTQRTEELEAYTEKLQQKIERKREEITSLQEDRERIEEQVTQKHEAIEYVEREMERLKAALTDQDEIFKSKMKASAQEHDQTLERVKLECEEELQRRQKEWAIVQERMTEEVDGKRSEINNLSGELVRLRIKLDEESKKNAQNDDDMRVLLAEIDRERELKQQSLRQIKSLFHQLQQESS